MVHFYYCYYLYLVSSPLLIVSLIFSSPQCIGSVINRRQYKMEEFGKVEGSDTDVAFDKAMRYASYLMIIGYSLRDFEANSLTLSHSRLLITSVDPEFEWFVSTVDHVKLNEQMHPGKPLLSHHSYIYLSLQFMNGY